MNTTNNQNPPAAGMARLGLVAGGRWLATFLLGLLAASILQRREEARAAAAAAAHRPVGNRQQQVGRKLSPRVRNLQEDGRLDHARPSTAAPSQRDYLEATPANVILFAGYSFAKEYRQARGTRSRDRGRDAQTKRVSDKTPATCWTCKSPDVPRLMAATGPGEVLCRQVRRFQDGDHAPHRLPRLPRAEHDAAADHAAGPPRGLPAAGQGHRSGVAPGDARRWFAPSATWNTISRARATT